MGDPRYPRRVWRKPKRPLNYNLKMDELRTLGNFGLRTKRELWKARTELSRLRKQARSLLALGTEIRQEREPVLLNSLEKIGLVKSGASLDDVLNLGIRDILARRLQTIVNENMDFNSPYQARQAVVHGHIMIQDRIVDVPSYIVDVSEEAHIKLVPGSPLATVLMENKKQADAAEAKLGTEDPDLETSGEDAPPPVAAAPDELQKAPETVSKDAKEYEDLAFAEKKDDVAAEANTKDEDSKDEKTEAKPDGAEAKTEDKSD